MEFIGYGLCVGLGGLLLFAFSWRLHKKSLALLAQIRQELEASQQVLANAAAAPVAVPAPAEPADRYIELPDGVMGLASDYERRDDGKLVRRDRWKTGFGNIVTILKGSRSEYEIADIVEMVRALAVTARADYESGGDGTAGSAPVWGPCPDKCNDGMLRKGEECPRCDGRGEIVIEEPVAKPNEVA